MDTSIFLLRLPTVSVLDLVGKDAAAILHNLTTNEVKSLSVDGPGVESFITNVKGKCIGHGMIFRTDRGYRLIGAAGQSDAIATQMDRYTIREDAEPDVIDDQVHPYLLVGPLPDEPRTFRELSDGGDACVPSYGVPWIDTPQGRRGRLILADPTSQWSPDQIALAALAGHDVAAADSLQCLEGDHARDAFHALRVTAGYPWYGTDFNDSHLPQEVNREPETISFTKGCYLGQETIARLDALGQVQKKLVLWSIADFTGGPLPAVDTKLFAGGEKPVGRLTSIAREVSADGLSRDGLKADGSSTDSAEQRVAAIGFARRSHFEVGGEATGTLDNKSFLAKVERA
ncbi:CAF17-like 4Fe-4S cluster assembly/insertion protein YgfZ [Allorhodopirellula solitaria]|uniref:CAF17-like 4Fe-4S cluster assembly/insertion protein YgfZ n=1 Tax=Allorhodopirellula solitaria TaxID=2527987 RepID=UPI001FEB4C02|nr:aminomethyltransferase [Allorhodopirellula solitaria]